ncbi:GNAT family N-acetyltransferase [Muriicola marianensis]|uniref:N-acetyltransferase n=1 Tax=Muriicola marianensis TaxID=1324801 RepID=A0ABQ1QMQ9_9FLAO|nr:GNAT family N-acetyltransferase [Muriicola marianensis]GGD37033.1 N-acetyltransferase [Muriicola marianensis]
MSISTRVATEADLPVLIDLLDAYRVFYKQSTDKGAARLFLEARFRERDSEIFLGEVDGTPVGFVQLYPSFSTVSLRPVFILNDLYVMHSARGLGVGAALLKKTQDFCTSRGYKGLALETAVDNPAQKLYERLGWKKDMGCFHYFWSAP